MEWFRMYHGMVSDDKWSLIARRSGQPRGFVVSVWSMLLEIASQNDERGNVESFDPEVADALFDMPDGAAEAIYNALCSGKNPRIVNGYILSWEKRQPRREREDNGNAERVRQHRERKRLEAERCSNETPCYDNVTPCNAIETPCNAPRTEKNREEKQENTYSASAAPDAACADDDAPLVGKKKKLTGKRKMSFLRFWEAFADKRGKVDAIDAWAIIPELTDTLVEHIVSAARRYAALRPELEAKGATPKMAQGWLTDRRWEDEPPGSCVPMPHTVIPPVPLPEVKSMTLDEVARNQKAALCSRKNLRIVDGCILSWEKRQPRREREDNGNAERIRQHRERKRLEAERCSNETPCYDNVTPCNAIETPCNAPRTEKNREEKKEENIYSASATPDAACADDDAPLVGKKKKLTGKRKMSFLRFWEAFADKRGKVGAIDAWAIIPELTDTLVERIVSAARRYAALRPELEAKGATPKMAQGWLTDRRWEDEPPGNCVATSHSVIPPAPLPEVKSMTPEEVARNQKAALERLKGEGRIASALKKPVSPNFHQALGGVQCT